MEVERKSIKLSEQDTRQGLINPLFSALGWNFSDFNSIKSEFRHKKYNDPVDYAFFHGKDKEKPVLLVEAKSLETNISSGKIVKQLCSYLGEMGVQWGVLTDGNKYIMYNSRAGLSFEDQKFLTMQIKTVDTEDGLSLDDLTEKFIALLSRECLENDDIQKVYRDNVLNRHIEEALNSLLTEPFDTLVDAIRREFKEDRVKVGSDVKITKKEIFSFLDFYKDEDGRVPPENQIDDFQSNEDILINISLSKEDKTSLGRPRRIALLDLLSDNLIKEGDGLRFQYKGEFFWGRVTGNGEIEMNGKTYATPSRAGTAITNRVSSSGWDAWCYRNEEDEWQPIKVLRHRYHEKHKITPISRKKNDRKIVKMESTEISSRVS